jgi:hypothetical protein
MFTLQYVYILTVNFTTDQNVFRMTLWFSSDLDQRPSQRSAGMVHKIRITLLTLGTSDLRTLGPDDPGTTGPAW